MSSRSPAPLRSNLSEAAALRAGFQITRPQNCLITLASVLMGGWLGVHALPVPLWIAAFSAAAVMAGANALNDLWDLETDRVNHPHRPLPSNRLSPRAAAVECVVLMALGLGLSLFLPPEAIATAVFACGCLVAYNRRLKHVPLAGNLAVSLLCGLAFFYGGFAAGAAVPAAVPALFATLYHLGREILKDAQDIPGDRIAPGGTLPLSWGSASSCRLAAGVYGLLILLTPVPYIFGLYGLPYLILVSLLDVMLAWIMFSVLRFPDTQGLRQINRNLKAGMMLGLLAILAGTL
ncbi:MAG: geranylgeranylglycerol-phosphate geranylgeranyltransferase [Gemmatimonadota bacterium]|nr:geranylgeranylglycerol-phosphate geranylgeranyltransferase [Gemmatimonadota bacterium]